MTNYVIHIENEIYRLNNLSVDIPLSHVSASLERNLWS